VVLENGSGILSDKKTRGRYEERFTRNRCHCKNKRPPDRIVGACGKDESLVTPKNPFQT